MKKNLGAAWNSQDTNFGSDDVKNAIFEQLGMEAPTETPDEE